MARKWLDQGCSHWFDDTMIEAQVLKKGLKKGLIAKKDINRSEIYMRERILRCIII
jgi:hypothetical protein